MCCMRAAYLAIIFFTERLIVYFTLITFVLMGNNLTADVTYEMSIYFNIFQLVVALYFPQGLILLSESIVSFNRLKIYVIIFLIYGELKSTIVLISWLARTCWSVLNFYRTFCWWTKWTRDASCLTI